MVVSPILDQDGSLERDAVGMRAVMDDAIEQVQGTIRAKGHTVKRRANISR